MSTVQSRSLPSLAPELERDMPEICPECESDDIIEDWKMGQNVCRSCGIVINERLTDLGCEWRTFTNDEPGTDPNRVGGKLSSPRSAPVGLFLLSNLAKSHP